VATKNLFILQATCTTRGYLAVRYRYIPTTYIFF